MHFRGFLAPPTLIAASRHRSGDERLSEQLGGEHNRRRLMNALANFLETGGLTVLEIESKPGSGLVLKHKLLHGGALW